MSRLMFMYFNTILYGMPSLCCNLIIMLLILKLETEHDFPIIVRKQRMIFQIILFENIGKHQC